MSIIDIFIRFIFIGIKRKDNDCFRLAISYHILYFCFIIDLKITHRTFSSLYVKF